MTELRGGHAKTETFSNIRPARLLLFCGVFLSSVLILRLGGPFTAGDILLGLAFLGVLGKAALNGPISPTQLFIACLVMVATGLSSIISIAPFESLATGGRVLFLTILLPLLFVLCLPTERSLLPAIRWFVAGAMLCALGTVYQLFRGELSIPGAEVTSAGRFSGLTGHVSDAGAIAAVAASYGLSQVICGGLGEKFWRPTNVFGLSSAAVGVVGLALSGSVSGMLATVCGVLAASVLSKRASLRGLALTVGLTVVAIPIGGSLLSRSTSSLTPLQRVQQTLGMSSGGDDLNTAASRLATDAAGLHAFLERPLTGVGMDSGSAIVLDGLGVHNFALASFYQGGLFLGIAIVLAVVYGLVCVYQCRKSTLAPLVMAILVSEIVFGLTAPSFYNRYLWIPVSFAVSLRYIFNSKHIIASGDRQKTFEPATR